MRRRPLDIREILAWADSYREATDKWPTKACGHVIGTLSETWLGIDAALRDGRRGLPGGSSLAQLLAAERGARNVQQLPPLTPEQILAWADDHHRRTGAWPTVKSGIIPDSGREKWSAIDVALQNGARGLPGGSSLPRLLAEHRGVRNRKGLPPLTAEQILAWADAHHGRTYSWPTSASGPIPEAPGETWMAVEMALSHGQRGLPGGSSLARLLAERRGVRVRSDLPDLSVEQVLVWADAFHARTGEWPRLESGPIPEAPGEKWSAVDSALKNGRRGLPGGSSLARLLSEQRGVRRNLHQPRFSRTKILAWADAYRRRTGRWPTADTGPVAEAPGETWAQVDLALRNGHRGLRGGSSLARLLAERRGKPHHLALPALSYRKILAWADDHHRRTGKWPNGNSGPVQAAPGEQWDRIDNALRAGLRGLPGGSSLLRLLARKRGLRNPLCLPPLTAEQIVQWADRHFRRTGRWPQYTSGPVADTAGETWAGIDSALRYGKRGLPGGSSLARLLAEGRAPATGPPS